MPVDGERAAPSGWNRDDCERLVGGSCITGAAANRRTTSTRETAPHNFPPGSATVTSSVRERFVSTADRRIVCRSGATRSAASALAFVHVLGTPDEKKTRSDSWCFCLNSGPADTNPSLSVSEARSSVRWPEPYRRATVTWTESSVVTARHATFPIVVL